MHPPGRTPLQKGSAVHELSIVTSLLAIVEEEVAKHAPARLKLVRVRCGGLAGVVPDAMAFAFEALTEGTPFEGARLELEEEPVSLRCACGALFTPEEKTGLLVAPCPVCGAQTGHSVETGRELYLQHIELE